MTLVAIETTKPAREDTRRRQRRKKSQSDPSVFLRRNCRAVDGAGMEACKLTVA